VYDEEHFEAFASELEREIVMFVGILGSSILLDGMFCTIISRDNALTIHPRYYDRLQQVIPATPACAGVTGTIVSSRQVM
jgi:hypothetical protein